MPNKLGRATNKRLALLRGQVTDLLWYGRIETTLARAKAVQSKAEKIITTRAGWMYVIKGSGRNAILIKISSDGKRRLLACTQFQRAIKITDTQDRKSVV